MGPKKAKKNKKQLEEEKAAAEEQRILEEKLEAARLAEEEEKRRIDEEKRRIEEEKRRQEELVRLNEQSPFVAERDAQMISKRAMAKESRIKDLDDKYLDTTFLNYEGKQITQKIINPLPDPDDEKDLTTFITLWREGKDKSMAEAVDNCQTAENVIKSIQLKKVEAMSQYDYPKIQWCQNYIDELRSIMKDKYDTISSDIMTYISNYTKYTDEEIEKLKEENTGGRKKDFSQRDDFTEPKPDEWKKNQDISLSLWANVSGKTQNYKKIEFPDFKSGIPRQNSSSTLIMRCMWTSFNNVSTHEQLKQANELVVGGVVLTKMYQYPQAARARSNWLIRSILSVEDSLKCIEYPDPQSTVQVEPIPVLFKLPPYVFTTDKDEPKVGVWDEKEGVWSTEYIESLEFDRTKRELVFETRKFGPIAYLQSKVLDMPFDSWYLRCTGQDQAFLSVVTKRGLSVNFEIGPLTVKIVEMDAPELKHLVNQELHAGILLQELQKCGINLIPEDEDCERGGIHLKDKGAEERAILDIAQTLKVFAFQSVKQSQEASAENIVVRLRENPDNDRVFLEDDESDWKTVMWWNNKVSYIKSKNSEEKFNPTIEDGQVTHAMLSLAVEGMQSPNAVEQCGYYHDIDFIDNVQRLLRLTRLLAFTTSAFDKRTLEEQQQ